MQIDELRSYLQYLYSQQRLPFDEIIDLCVQDATQATHPSFRLQALPNAFLFVELPRSSLCCKQSKFFRQSTYWVKTWPSKNFWGSDPVLGSQIVASLAATHTQGLPNRTLPNSAIPHSFLPKHLVQPIYQDDRICIEPYLTAKPIEPREVSSEQLSQAALVLAEVHQSPKPSLAKVRSVTAYLLEGIARVKSLRLDDKNGHFDDKNKKNQLILLHRQRIAQWLRRLESQQLSIFSKVCDQPLALSHFDVTVGNWLWCEHRRTWFLIDWEYTALANPWVDLATFVTSFQLTREQSLYFLRQYFSCRGERLHQGRVCHTERLFYHDQLGLRKCQDFNVLTLSAGERYNQQGLWRQLQHWKKIVEMMTFLWKMLV